VTGWGWVGILALTLCEPACGTLLTKAQTDVVQDFARANGAYAKLPGSVLRSYGDVHFTTRVLGATEVSPQLAQIDQALKTLREIDALAVRLDAALDIFDQYRALLERLSSPDLTDLDGAASSLGSAFEGSIKAYNAVPAVSPLPQIGPDIAAGARALGGVFVRHRQLAYLRKFVEQADPVIARLASDVENLVASTVAGSLNADADNIRRTLKVCLETCAVKPGPADLALYAETLRKDQVTLALAGKVRDASRKLASSHKALEPALRPAPSIREARAEVDGLIAELTAAAKIKSKLDAATQSACSPGGRDGEY
jgi:hypothetical protein